jgi:cobalt-zinc-cadmium efflux system outer membrane protein
MKSSGRFEVKSGRQAALLGAVLWGMLCAGAALASDPVAEAEQSWRGQLTLSAVINSFGYSFTDTSGPLDDVRSGEVDTYVVSALYNNARLRSAHEEILAMEAAARRASALPDPRLGWTEYLKSVETRVGPQERAFSLSQSFPWFGTLSLQGDVVDQKVEAARAAFDKTALEIIAGVKSACYEMAFLESAIGITQEHLQLLSQWENVAQARYASGQGPYTAVVKAQVELGVLGNRLAELEDRRRPLAANLKALLNRPGQEELKVPELTPAQPLVLDRAQLEERMLAANPALLAWDHRSREWETVRRLAGKQGLPSFLVGVNYIQTGPARMDGVDDSGTDALMATIGVSLPLWRGKYHDADLEAGSRVLAARSAKQEQVNSLAAALESSLFKYRDSARKMDLHDTTLIPKGRQSLDAVRSAYESGKGGFLDLIDAQRMLLEFELNRERAAIDLRINESEIERLVAGPLAGNDP